jgi:hypothetical protein
MRQKIIKLNRMGTKRLRITPIAFKMSDAIEIMSRATNITQNSMIIPKANKTTESTASTRKKSTERMNSIKPNNKDIVYSCSQNATNF